MILSRRIRRKIYNLIPLWVRRHDFELFAAMLCFMAGVPLVTGNIAPASVEAQLPMFIVYTWGTFLTIGPLLMFLGIYKAYTGVNTLVTHIFWMRIEALGLTCLGWASLVYGVCVLSVNPTGGWIAAMLSFIFFLTCLSREVYIQHKIEVYKIGVGVDA